MKKTIKYTILGMVILFMSSCKDFLNINTDPSVPQKVGAGSLMAPIYAQMVRGETFDTRYFGLYTQMYAISSTGDTWERHGYISGNDANGEKWRSHYFGIGKKETTHFISIINPTNEAEQTLQFCTHTKGLIKV